MDSIDPMRCDAKLDEKDWCGLVGGEWYGDETIKITPPKPVSNSASNTTTNTANEQEQQEQQQQEEEEKEEEEFLEIENNESTSNNSTTEKGPGCNMKAASFVGKTLDGGSFAYANLTGKDFSGASLQNTNLTGAVLINVTLHHVDLRGAILYGANLKGVHGQLSHCPETLTEEDETKTRPPRPTVPRATSAIPLTKEEQVMEDAIPYVFLDHQFRKWMCVNKYLVGPEANLIHAQIDTFINTDMLTFVIDTRLHKELNSTNGTDGINGTNGMNAETRILDAFLEENNEGNDEEVQSVVSQVIDDEDGEDDEKNEYENNNIKSLPTESLPMELQEAPTETSTSINTITTTTTTATTANTDSTASTASTGNIDTTQLPSTKHSKNLKNKKNDDTLDILHNLEISSNGQSTHSASTMNDIHKVSHLLHLDLPLPKGCNMSMGLNHTDVDASGRPLLVLKHLSPECGCINEIKDASMDKTNFNSKNKKMSSKCRSALTHYAWGVGCHSMATLYHSTCIRYKKDATKDATEDATENQHQHQNQNSKTKKNTKTNTIKTRNKKVNLKSEDIVQYLTQKMPSFTRACDYLSQLVHFRCISQTKLSSTPMTAKIAETAGKLVTPTGRQRLPLTIDELLSTSNATATKINRNKFRFQENELDGTVPADFVRFRVVKSMTAVVKVDAEATMQYSSGGVNDLPTNGPGGNAPLYIKPITRKKNIKKKEKKRKKLLKNEGLIFEWLRQDKICTTGKGPEPKRSFTMTPLSDGMTHVVFGGIGLDGGNGKKNDIPHVLIAGNMKLEAKIYNDTHLLLPMNGLSTTAYASAGVGYDGVTCAASGPTPVPPKVEPDEPLRP